MARTYRSSYKRFIIKHTIFMILNFFGIEAYCVVVIKPAVQAILYGSGVRGKQILFLLIFPLAWTVLAFLAALSALKYCQAVLSLLKGNVSVKLGCITQKQKKIYDVTRILPEGVKKSSVPHLLLPARFAIQDCDCERGFQVGDGICVVYPASNMLNLGLPNTIPAIYAFSTDESRRLNDIPKETLSGWLVLWEILVFLITAALSVSFCLFWNRVLAMRGFIL